MLVPARLPHVLDIAYYDVVADVQYTSKAALALPAVAVISMPIKLISHRKLEIEYMNALHRRPVTVQLYWVQSEMQRHPAGGRHSWFSFPLRPFKWQPRGRLRAPYDFSRPHRR